MGALRLGALRLGLLWLGPLWLGALRSGRGALWLGALRWGLLGAGPGDPRGPPLWSPASWSGPRFCLQQRCPQ